MNSPRRLFFFTLDYEMSENRDHKKFPRHSPTSFDVVVIDTTSVHLIFYDQSHQPLVGITLSQEEGHRMSDALLERMAQIGGRIN